MHGCINDSMKERVCIVNDSSHRHGGHVWMSHQGLRTNAMHYQHSHSCWRRTQLFECLNCSGSAHAKHGISVACAQLVKPRKGRECWMHSIQLLESVRNERMRVCVKSMCTESSAAHQSS